MAQPFIVEITSSGTIVLPEEIRKYIPPGTKFTVFARLTDANPPTPFTKGGIGLRSQRGNTISFKKVEEPDIPRTPEFVTRHQNLCDKLSKWADEQGITEHDIKETIKEVRAKQRAKSGSQ